jgi:hypothetical protein
MLKSILIFILILALLFLVYQFVIVNIMKSESTHEEFYEENSQPVETTEQVEKGMLMPEDRAVAPGGPNAPSSTTVASVSVPVAMPEEQPFDPYSEKQQSPYAGDDNRYPERMFRPAPEMNDVHTAVGAGIAAPSTQYNPENVMNGSEFMSGVIALDSASDSGLGYSPL